MSSDSWQPMPHMASGTVAARIQALQHVQHLKTTSPKSSPVPRTMSQAVDAGVTIGRGKRSDLSFTSPAGRVSRDGVDAIKRDDQQPIRTFSHKPHPSMEEKEAYKRPATSLGTGNVISKGICQPYSIARRRSLGASNELVGARAKLRPVGENNKEPDSDQEKRRSRGKTHDFGPKVWERKKTGLDELRSLIDEALEERNGLPQLHSIDNSGLPTPQPPLLRRWQSMRSPTRPPLSRRSGSATRRPSRGQRSTVKSPASSPQKSWSNTSDHILPHSSSETDRVQYPKAATSLNISDVLAAQREHCPSPVKNKAAMFESLMHHDQHLMHGRSHVDCPNRRSGKMQELCTMHSKEASPTPAKPQDYVTSSALRAGTKMKGQSLEPTKGNSTLIPLALPRLLSPKPRVIRGKLHPSHESTLSFATALQSQTDLLSASGHDEILDIPQELPHGKERRSSFTRLFKWGVFTQKKSPYAAPHHSSVDANAELEYLDDNERPAQLKGIVQELLARSDPPGEVSPCSKNLNSKVERSRSDRFMQSPIQEAAGNLIEGADQVANEIQTPRKELANDRETLNSHSPKKLAPSLPFSAQQNLASTPITPTTPTRGRRQTASRTLGSGHDYAIEQRFALSRSRSRTEGGGIRVSVEVQSSKASPGRCVAAEDEVTDHIFIIRANVEPMEGVEEERRPTAD